MEQTKELRFFHASRCCPRWARLSGDSTEYAVPEPISLDLEKEPLDDYDPGRQGWCEINVELAVLSRLLHLIVENRGVIPLCL